jgi:acyl carrier protein
MNHFVLAKTPLARDRKRALAGLDGEDAAGRTGGIVQSPQREEQHRAEDNPHGVEPRKGAPDHAAIIRAVTRAEIEEQLIAIVRQEKNVADELLKPETPLAEAGIDSLDSLTILFAIEEQFKISIPDDEARAVRTFGDLIDIIVKRTS